MRIVYLNSDSPYIIGRQGETNAVTLRVDVTEWVTDFPNGTGVILFTRPNKVVYPLETSITEIDGKTYLQTIVTTKENKVPGWVVLQAQWYNGDTLVKSMMFSGKVLVSGDGTTVDPTETVPNWVAEWMSTIQAAIEGAGELIEAAEIINKEMESFHQSVSDSEAWAIGTRSGEAVESTDITYHNNSKYYSESIADTAENVEAWANGTRGGANIPATDPAYHKNGKYYNTQAAASASAAAASASEAMSGTPEGYSNVVASISPTYDGTKTYAVGDYCMNGGKLYCCSTAITEAEAEFNSSHWTQVNAVGELRSLKREIYTDNDVADTWVAGTLDATSGATSDNLSRIRLTIGDPTVSGIQPTNGYSVLIYAYNLGSYVGCWSGSGFTKTISEIQWVNRAITFAEIGPNYQYKIVAKNSGGTSSITTSDGANILLIKNASDKYTDKVADEENSHTISAALTAAGNTWKTFSFKVGHQYVVSNTGSSALVLHTVGAIADYDYIETISSGLASGVSMTFTPTKNANYLHVYTNGAGSYTITDKNTIDYLNKNIDASVADMSNALICEKTGWLTWESGSYDIYNGSNVANSNRIRAIINDKNVIGIAPKNGYSFLIYAYNGSTYIGAWNGYQFVKASSLYWNYFTEPVYFTTLNPAYQYRIAVKNSAGTAVSVSDGDNVCALYRMSDFSLGNVVNANNDCVFTLGYMYLRRHDSKFWLSVDGGKTYTKNIGDPTGFGTLRFAYVFKNGTLLVCDHQKAYYTDNWTEWTESSCVDLDGNTYVPTDYDTFTTEHRTARVIIDGTELLVFGNYNITDESNNRDVIWYTKDNGHTLKVAYEFNVSGALSIRHIHGVYYCEKQDNFWVCTGDSGDAARLIKGVYDMANDEWTFTEVGHGSDYKWACITFFGDHFYYCHDFTPGDIMEAKIGDEDDVTKHHTILSDLPNDPVGLFVGEQTGEMVVTLSLYRTGTSTSSNTAAYDSKRMWYSANRKDFVEINGNDFPEIASQTYSAFFLFCGPNAEGKILASYEQSAAGGGSFTDRDLIPGVFIDDIVRRAGYNCNFKS